MASHTRIKKIVIFETLFVVVVAVYALWSIVRAASTSIPDFSVLYYSAQNLLAGRSLYHDTTLYTGLGYPAVSLVPYIPFTILPYKIAASVWVVLSFAAYLATTYLSLRLVGKESVRLWAIVSAVGFLAFPTKFTFGMGQVNYIALSLLLLGVSSLRLAPPIRSMVLAISLLFKPHFIFVYVGLFFTELRKYIVMSVVGVVCLFVLMGALRGWAPDREYLRDMVPHLLAYESREIYYNQGVGGFISRIFGGNSAYLSYGVIVVIISSSIYTLIKKERRSALHMLAVLLPMQILVEPLAWQHHLVFLLPTFVIAWFTSSSRAWQRKMILMACFLLVGWNIKNPVYWQGNMIGSLVLSHGFIGCFVLWYMSIRDL